MMISFLRYSFRTLALSLLAFPLYGQISQGGKPLMNTEDYNASRVLYVLDPEEQEMIDGMIAENQASFRKAIRFAIEKPVDLSPDANGEWVVRNGVRVWRAHIVSAGAYSIGVWFSEFELGDNARLFLYDPDGKNIMGGYTSENNKTYGSFTVGHIPGDELIIELQVYGSDQDYGKLRIGTVSHAFLPYLAQKGILDTGLGTSQQCEIDINCSEGDDWQIIKRSVCFISTGVMLCTGVLVNNTSYNGNPYVLTAEHCINKEFRAQSSVFYFAYENSECGLVDGRRNKSISGSTMLSTGDSIDFTLVKLSSRPPKEYDVYYAGWDARPQTHLKAVTLHHPNADAKKISFEDDPLENATVLPGDLNDYLVESNFEVTQWDIGSTEGGSSGCPLFNTSKKLIGSLSGGLASCGDSIGYDPVNDRVIYSLNGNERDFFSKLYYQYSFYWDGKKNLKHWLDPELTGQLVLGGLSPLLLDVEDKRLPDQVQLAYPNPSKFSFAVNIPFALGEGLSLRVMDLSGKVVFRQNVLNYEPVEIQTTGWTPGLYILRLDGESIRHSERIIIGQ